MSNLIDNPEDEIMCDKDGIGGDEPAYIQEITETLTTISSIRDELRQLRSLRDQVNNAVMSVALLQAPGRPLGAVVEELAQRFLLALDDIDRLEAEVTALKERIEQLENCFPSGNRYDGYGV
jgi:chromosome segregation ATPase